jgi:putative copper resistance protein D
MGTMPVFQPDGGPVLVLARGLAVAFILSVAGTATFRTVVLPRALGAMTPDVTGRIERALTRWLRASALGAGLGLLAWSLALTANLASPQGIVDWAGSFRAVLSDTAFGHVLLLQAALLASAVVILGRRPGILRWWGSGILATAAAVAETGHGHAFAMAHGLTMLEVSEALHLWAAAVAARWFSPLGQVCLIVIALSALLQGWILVASIAALKDTAYGWTAMLKLCLYGVLFGFAVLNRYRLCPALRGSRASTARGALIASLVVQTGFGLLVVLAAALLGQLRPGMDMGIDMGMAG